MLGGSSDERQEGHDEDEQGQARAVDGPGSTHDHQRRGHADGQVGRPQAQRHHIAHQRWARHCNKHKQTSKQLCVCVCFKNTLIQ